MALTTNTTGNVVKGTYDNVKDTFPASNESTRTAATGILTTDTLVGGTGYSDSIGVATTGGTGTGCTVDITTAAGVVTAISINAAGTGYTVADTLTITTGGANATFDALTVVDVVSTVNGLNKQVVGVATTFLTDVEEGDFIWFTTTDELIKIENIVSDTQLSLIVGTSSALSGVAYKIVKKNGFKNVSYLIDLLGTAEINQTVTPTGTSETFGDTKPNGQGGGRRLSPILVDSTTNSNIVIVTGV